LVWVRLNDLAQQAGQTIYQLKHGLFEPLSVAATQATFPENDCCVSLIVKQNAHSFFFES
jgi:hypothetical protein